MRIWNPKFSFMFFIIIILLLTTTIQLSSGRYIHRSLSSSETEAEETEFSTNHSWHSSAKSPEASMADKSQPIYDVSYRTVPGGPNPLHN
ncbi:hypothetical protein CCACVL1_13651 [Corchorus capsularis]|uniref:Uncharacterized protein n=1 Tax=Corchorus capsularis TaxID=210143 RepID=A0A1R3IA51_COCAP|nr:hypothetical protein CCACVL1_13651 [Corchorus capsularis]